MSDSIKRTLLSLLAPHFVSLNWMDESEANAGVHHRSAFLVEVAGCWLLVTAGHGIEGVEEAVAGGYALPVVNLADCYGDEASSKQAMIFDYLNANKVFVHDEESGIDFGVVELRPYYRLNIEKHRGAEPLADDVWMVDPDRDADGYYLVGVANESISQQASQSEGPARVNVRLIGYPVERIPASHTRLKRDREMFYGKLVDDPTMPYAANSIVGMSGGPIFGIKQNAPGDVTYWLVALQSYWDKDTREIRGSLTAPVFARLEEIARKFLARRKPNTTDRGSDAED